MSERPGQRAARRSKAEPFWGDGNKVLKQVAEARVREETSRRLAHLLDPRRRAGLDESLVTNPVLGALRRAGREEQRNGRWR